MTTRTQIPPPTTEGPTALDLLTEIALLKESGNATDLKQAEKLFTQLLTAYERFFRGLAGKLMPFDGSSFHFDIDDLHSQLVVKIWKNADKFTPRDVAPAAIQKQFIGWTAKILKNILNEALSIFDLEITRAETLELGWEPFAGDHPEPSERAKIVAEILEDMDPDDAEILRWSAIAMPLDGSQMRPDPEERAALCRKLNVTEAGLRKRRGRALKALRDEFERRLA